MLFVCIGNSCRSQMAEAWAKRLKARAIEALSAGLAPARVQPLTRRVMAEVGVGMQGHSSKGVWEFRGVELDYVVSLSAKVQALLGDLGAVGKYVHRHFDDPLVLSANAATEEEALQHYRRVREEIRAFVEALPGILEQMEGFKPKGPIR